MSEQEAGMHVSVYKKKANFPNEEWKLVEKLAKEWYVTNAGEVNIAQSHYKYALIKATVLYREMFGFERELIVVFSNYRIFQARSIDAIDTIYNLVLAQYPSSRRVERICSVLISKDIEVEIKIRKILTESKESQVIVPISYEEFLTNQDSYFLRNKFKSSFYDRDLFDITSPLRKDLYFFGRADLINKLGDRHFSNENSGVFGLRRSGKTSLIYAVERQMERVAYPSIYIPCDDTSFQKRRWTECLYYVLEQLVDKYQTKKNRLKGILSPRESYSEKDAQAIFKKDLLAIYEKLGKKPILLIFDEIERITFNTAVLEHWQKGLDFIFFWGSLKSTFNALNRVFSYMIVGTNPTCIEAPKIQEYDNPIFQSVSVDYLERFDVDQTRDMVEQLGNFLGVTFDDVIYGKLVEDYGGHPFLIRQVCSLMYQANKTKIPIRVDRPMYQRAKDDFAQDKGIKYMSMILAVLTEFYKDEYTMLTYLALDDVDFFNNLAKDSPEYVAHLVGYGIISRNQDGTGYDFRMDAIQQHLKSRNRYKKLSLTLDEKRQEISQRRNDLELKLRDIIRQRILGHYNKVKDAKTTVWKYLKHDSKNKKIDMEKLKYSELFNPSKVNIFFIFLKDIVEHEWDIFEEIFKEKDAFKDHMQAVNKYRKVDAHAGSVTEGEFTDFRTNIEWLETCLIEWEKLAG